MLEIRPLTKKIFRLQILL